MIDTEPQQSLAHLLRAVIEPQAAGIDSEGSDTDRLPCRQVDPEVFFAERPADVEYAKSLCQKCPIQQSCLAGALQRAEPWGVWGGQLFASGDVVAQKRPRGRPRKHARPASGTAPRQQPVTAREDERAA